MSFDPGAEFRRDGKHIRGWRYPTEGLDLLRVAIVGSLVSSIALKLFGSGGGVGLLVMQIIASLVFGIMTVAALGKWRTVPRETRAAGLADMAWVGSIINVIGVGVSVIMAVMALTGTFRSASAIQPFLILVVVVSLIGSLLQTIGFLLSARAVALHLSRSDIAGRATATLIFGAATVLLAVLSTLGALGRGDGAFAALIFVALMAIVALVLFLMTLSGLQQAIRDQPDVADAFS